MIPATATFSVALLDGAPGEPFPDDWRLAIMSRLLEAGFPVRMIRNLASLPGNLLVLGRLNGAGPALVPENVHDVSTLDVDAVVDFVRQQTAEIHGPPAPKRWKPWFPVIDYQRCTNCMQCLSFCLFEVYGVSKGGGIQVQNESNCKTDCPACSRVCPEVAIMFPKYKAGPINGEEVSSEDLRREAMKVDISMLLGGDIYSMLRDRSARAKSRFSLERNDDRALRERQRCLDKLKKVGGGLEIPAEVLASLPSSEEIQLKAEQARHRAAEALRLRDAQHSDSPSALPGGSV